jgi:carboxylesterase type B
LSSQKLVSYWDGSAFPPILDEEWMALPEKGVEFGSVEYWTDSPSWLKEAISGCTKDEAILFCGQQWQDWTWEQAKASLESVLPAHVLEIVLNSPVYKDKSSPLEAMNAVVSDASFIGAAVAGAEMQAARNQGNLRVYFYIMEAPDQHPGPLQGWAAHAADVSTVFYQPAQQDYPEQAAVADDHSKRMISFIYGDGPGSDWKEVGESDMYMAFTGKDTKMKHLHSDRTDREVVFTDPTDQELFYGSGFGIIASSLRSLNG